MIGWGLSQHRIHRPAVTDPQGFSVEWLRVPAGQRSAPILVDETAVLVVAGDNRKTVHFKSDEPTAAAALDTTLDAGGRLARLSLLPPAMTV